jgi:hypothetical protein
MLGCQWMDVVFIPLYAAGLEKIVPIEGTPPGGYGTGIIYADYTHSLVGALVLSAIFGIAGGIPWGRRAGVVLAGVSFSHWVLDFITHRQDMPLLPGNAGNFPRMGLGLWRFPVATAAVELALVVAGAGLYWWEARRVSDQSIRANWAGALALAFGLLTLGLNVAGM